MYASPNEIEKLIKVLMKCFWAIVQSVKDGCAGKIQMILISNSVIRNRFKHIMSNIHCCNNLDKRDRFAKMRPIFAKINSTSTK